MGPKNGCSYADLAMGEIDAKAKFLGLSLPREQLSIKGTFFIKAIPLN